MPKSLDQLEQFISRRLAVRQDVVHLSADDQQQLVNVASVYVNILQQTADKLRKITQSMMRSR